MKKKILGVLLIGGLMGTLLTGCGEKVPTADELMEQVYSEDLWHNADMDVEMSMGVESQGMKMTVLSIDANAEIDDDVTHMEGEMSINFFMQMSMDVDMYATKEDGVTVTYQKDSGTGEWTRSEEEDESAEMFDNLTSTAFTNIEMVEPQKEDTTYTINAQVAVDPDNWDMSLFSDETDATPTLDKADCVLIFDRETNELQKISYDIRMLMTDEDGEESAMTVTAEFKFNQIGGTDVSIPLEVTNNAVDED